MPDRSAEPKKYLSRSCLGAASTDVRSNRSTDRRGQRQFVITAGLCADDSQYAFAPVHVVKAKPGNFPGAKAEVEQTACDGVVAPTRDGTAIEGREQTCDLFVREGRR